MSTNTTIRITSLTPEGLGVSHDLGKVVFVPNTAVGDEVEVSIIKELKNSSIARIERIVAPSPNRVAPDCAVCRQCGGCVFRHISYNAELELKRGFVRDAFARIGGLEVEVGEVIHGNPLFYRNKVQYPFAPDKNGRCTFGYYARRSHRIVGHEVCYLQDSSFYNVASECASIADRLGIRAYDEGSRTGKLRHVVMRRGRDGKMLVCLVIKGGIDEKLRGLAREIYKNFDFVIGVHINCNDRPDNVIFGERTVCVVGDETLTDTLCGRKFELSPTSFYQVNAVMAELLYSHASSLINGNDGTKIILDLYCGAGTVGLCVAGEGDKLCGVEVVDSAVKNANRNAVLNGRSEENTLFVRGDASVGVAECKKRFGEPDVIIVDPPRKGLDRAVIDTIVSANPKKAIYISCDPATLARDCAIFKESGYTARFAQPFDLFPRTAHVETVVLMTRNKGEIK